MDQPVPTGPVMSGFSHQGPIPSGSRREPRARSVDKVFEFRNVGMEFANSAGERRQVLDDISFSLAQNQFTVLIGPSGCGKTTLLQLASGLLRPTSGAVVCRNEVVRGLQEDIGYVTQDANLFPWYTLQQNVELPLMLRGVSAAERRERVREYLAFTGLSGFEKHYPHQLSGGMQKRASIVRTLIYAPSVVLMDEPFGSLDAQTKMVMQDYLLRLWAEHRTTVLFITHDLNEAVVLADNVIVLSSQPTRVRDDKDIGLTRPRNVFEPYQMDGFVDTHKALWEAFRGEVGAAFGGDQGQLNLR